MINAMNNSVRFGHNEAFALQTINRQLEGQRQVVVRPGSTTVHLEVPCSEHGRRFLRIDAPKGTSDYSVYSGTLRGSALTLLGKHSGGSPSGLGQLVRKLFEATVGDASVPRHESRGVMASPKS